MALRADADAPNHVGDGIACAATFHLAEQVGWLIAESTAAGAGADASLQAGTVDSSADTSRVVLNWVDVTFTSPIQNPVCLSQIQSHNGGDFW